MAMAPPQPVFFTPPPAPRHLAELRIEPAHSAVAFSAPCGGGAAAASGRKRRCLLPASSVRKRMLLELAPFGLAPTPPTPPPSPSAPTRPVTPRAASSPAAEFSFAAGLRPTAPTPGGGGNMFAFVENAPTTPGGSDATSALSFLPSPAKPASGAFAFLAATERSKTPTATGPTATGGFAFAAPTSPEPPLTPPGSNTSGGLTFVAPTPERPLTPTEPTAPLPFPKPPATAGSESGGFAFPSPAQACAHIGSPSPAAAKETTPPPAGLATPPFVFSASRSPRPPRSGTKKRLRPHLRIDTTPRRRSLRQWEDQPQEQQLAPPAQKLAKTNSSVKGDAPLSSVMSGACCAFFTSPAKAAKQVEEAKNASSEASRSPAGSRCKSPVRPPSPEKPSTPVQEAKNASSEASRSPAGSRCVSPVRPPSPEKPCKPEQDVEVSSAVCSGTEVVVRVTCKCGLHREFSFDHHIWSTSSPVHPHRQSRGLGSPAE